MVSTMALITDAISAFLSAAMVFCCRVAIALAALLRILSMFAASIGSGGGKDPFGCSCVGDIDRSEVDQLLAELTRRNWRVIALDGLHVP